MAKRDTEILMRTGDQDDLGDLASFAAQTALDDRNAFDLD